MQNCNDIMYSVLHTYAHTHTHTHTEYVYLPAAPPYSMPEDATMEVSFVLTNPPPPGVGFAFGFNVLLATEDGTAIGEPTYM